MGARSFKAAHDMRVGWKRQQPTWRNQMPVILWLLGVPLAVIVLLMLFGVF
jgi:hypothetical protein